MPNTNEASPARLAGKTAVALLVLAAAVAAIIGARVVISAFF